MTEESCSQPIPARRDLTGNYKDVSSESVATTPETTPHILLTCKTDASPENLAILPVSVAKMILTPIRYAFAEPVADDIKKSTTHENPGMTTIFITHQPLIFPLLQFQQPMSVQAAFSLIGDDQSLVRVTNTINQLATDFQLELEVNNGSMFAYTANTGAGGMLDLDPDNIPADMFPAQHIMGHTRKTHVKVRCTPMTNLVTVSDN